MTALPRIWDTSAMASRAVEGTVVVGGLVKPAWVSQSVRLKSKALRIDLDNGLTRRGSTVLSNRSEHGNRLFSTG